MIPPHSHFSIPTAVAAFLAVLGLKGPARRIVSLAPDWVTRRVLRPRRTIPYQHWCRVVMDRETPNIVRNLNFADFTALEISGTKWGTFGFRDYQSVDFPEFDICTQKLDRTFDLVIAEQVFEHLLWPYRAGRNVYEMLRPGGYFLITTPFLIRVHEFPVDCTRWTPDGLKYFLAECGFNIDDVKVWSWGNRECVVANFNEWMPYRPEGHSLSNEPEFPLVVWALARKTTSRQ